MFLYLLIFLIAFVSTLLLTPVVRLLALKIGAIDNPAERKVHEKPIPRLGGLALYCGFILAAVVGLFASYFSGVGFTVSPVTITGVLLSATMLLIIGIIDDVRGVRPVIKLFFQVVAASVAVYFGVEIGFLSNPFNGFLYLGVASIPITILWLVGITNAVNLIDGLDGLASGIAAIASVTLFFVALRTNQPVSAVILLALAGASAGFLRYNFNPASIFLGDSGSLFVGFVLASASVVGVLKSTLLIALVIPVMILGVPIFDTIFTIIRRIRARVHIFEADDRHIHHRLLEAGLTHREAVMAIYFVCFLLSSGALAVTFLNTFESLILLGVIMVVAGISVNTIRERISDGS